MNLDNLIPDAMKLGDTPEPKRMAWSPMQEAIFHAVRNTSDNLSIEAVAGSGKTTTILHAMNMVPGKVLFLAFNRSIAMELQERTPMGTDCKTFNALGHGLLRRKTRGRLDKWKLSNLLKPQMSSLEYREWGFDLIKLVGRLKSNGVLEPLTYEGFRHEVEHSDIPMNRIDYATERLMELWEESLDVSDTFTFDDQLYMPVFWNQTFPAYDCVFVDEAQDLNKIQHMMLERLAMRGARIIAVGDSRQAIYGFRGALTNSMAQLGNKFNTTELPLSVCYRCDRTIVEEAQEIVPEITPADNADVGTITHVEQTIDPADIPDDAIVMCRTNAPMFRYALRFLQDQRPCLVMSNFGENLIKFVKSFDVTKTEDLKREIEAWRYAQVKEAEDRELYHKINSINDKAQSLFPFCDQYKIKSQVVQALERLLRSDTGPRLCTIHKAKGLEADYAYILRPDLVPGPWIEPGTEEYAQEENLLYVAITRAAKHLVYMGDDDE